MHITQIRLTTNFNVVLSLDIFFVWPNLLKLATMMGMGRVIQRTPQMAHSEATSFPAEVLGAISP
jgi:hypothetical protein